MPKEVTFNNLFNNVVTNRLAAKQLIRLANSNLFVLDKGWYCVLVEFQHSKWSNGIYLNVGVDFNFYPRDYFLFGHAVKETNFTAFSDEKQLAEIFHSLCDMAIWEVENLTHKFSTIIAAKRMLDADLDVWSYYEKAILTALTGDFTKAIKYIQRKVSPISYDNDKWELLGFAKDVQDWLTNETTFAYQISALVNSCRAMKNLPAVGAIAFDLDLPKKRINFLNNVGRFLGLNKA